MRSWASLHGVYVHDAVSLASQHGGIGWRADALLEAGVPEYLEGRRLASEYAVRFFE